MSNANEAARRELAKAQERVASRHKAQEKEISPEDIEVSALTIEPMEDDDFQYGYVKFKDGTKGYWAYTGGSRDEDVTIISPTGERLNDFDNPYYDIVSQSYEYSDRQLTDEEMAELKQVIFGES